MALDAIVSYRHCRDCINIDYPEGCFDCPGRCFKDMLDQSFKKQQPVPLEKECLINKEK